MKTVFGFSLLLFFTCIQPANDSLDFAEFKKLHDQVKPADEVWKSIPWHLDLKSAQKQSIEQEKPLFIWAMDGHPLGCT